MKRKFLSKLAAVFAVALAAAAMSVSVSAEEAEVIAAPETVVEMAEEAGEKEAAGTGEELTIFEDRKDGTIYFTYYNDGTAIITDFSGTETNYNIPSTVTSNGNTYKVTGIKAKAFYDCDNLINVTIPEGVTYIDNLAFAYCDSLTSITIPDSVTEIYREAFRGCKSLSSITIPKNVESIGTYVFYNCVRLTAINVASDNSTYKSVKGVLFSKDGKTIITYPCGKTEKSYTIPNGVTTVGKSSFDNCDNLVRVTIPDSVTVIDEYAFYDCDSLTSAALGSGITTINNAAFYSCDSLESIAIPDSTLRINNDVFAYCKALKSVALGKNIASIGGGAFYDCSALTTVYYAGSETYWGYISIGSSNSALKNANIYYNTTIKPSLTIYPGNGKVIIKWMKVANAKKYNVYLYDGAKFTSKGTTTKTNFTVTGVANGRNYGYLVRAYVDGAWTTYTSADIKYAKAINKPVVTAYAGNTKVRLNWGKISGATKYRVYTYYNGQYTAYRNTTVNYCDVRELVNGRTYGFLVTAYVNGRWTTFNAYDRVTAKPIAKPVITSAVAGNKRVAIKWAAVRGATKYAVYYQVGGKYYPFKSTTATSCTVTGLANGKKHAFVVRACINGKWTTFNEYDRVFATPKA